MQETKEVVYSVTRFKLEEAKRTGASWILLEEGVFVTDSVNESPTYKLFNSFEDGHFSSDHNLVQNIKAEVRPLEYEDQYRITRHLYLRAKDEGLGIMGVYVKLVNIDEAIALCDESLHFYFSMKSEKKDIRINKKTFRETLVLVDVDQNIQIKGD
ncbi:hypothetical protein [Vibrio phage vB_VmeM-Yong XC32]|nr:hypothetical protein [Vibrio phage vB_VmeM-Yong XC31]QAX96493.1 hypothetical protein [Vibrio phage vB_VmeM-Yong XC32]QAX96810.1 hypothetical protein [Vibrio phage vB_VmeM-Yong MS31]QAX97129.1 hypothetical protein [Vibrio phage vB_VmeM-Yong MS32]